MGYFRSFPEKAPWNMGHDPEGEEKMVKQKLKVAEEQFDEGGFGQKSEKKDMRRQLSGVAAPIDFFAWAVDEGLDGLTTTSTTTPRRAPGSRSRRGRQCGSS